MSDPVAQGGDERELRRLNRALRMLSDSNQSLIRITDEGQLLNEVCRIAVETGGYRMAWVGFPVNDERKTVRVAAVVGFDKGYLESMGIVWADVPRGRGPTGTAIRTGRVRIIHDVRTDPNTVPWREAARERGYESMAALPLLSEGRVLGALSVNAGEAGAFDDEEVKILTELAGDLAFGLTALRTRAEHARAEELLHKSGEVFRAIVENSPDLILRFDRELRLTYVNPALCRLFGLPAEAFLRQPVGTVPREARTADNRNGVDQVRESVERVFAGGESAEREVRWLTPGGERVFSVRYSPERDRAGAVTSVLAVARDITERRRAEESLQSVLRHARTTVMQSIVTAPEGWAAQGAEGSAPHYRWESRFEDEAAAQEVMPLALAPGESYYDGWVRAKHRDDLEPMSLVAARAFAAGAASWRQEFRAIDRHGRVHWFAQVASLRAMSPGRWQVTTINTDITERKGAEEAMRESQARLEMANRATQIGPWDWNLVTNEVQFSAEWKRQLGYEPHEIAGRYEEWESRLHPDDRERVLAAVRAYVAGERPDYDVEFRLRHKDGSYRWIFTRGDILRAPDGQPLRMIGCHLDITERRQAEEALRHSQQAYVSLVNAIDGIVWELDVSTFRFTFVSQQAERLLGYPVERWLKEPAFWPDHLHPDDRDWAIEYCVKATNEKRDHSFRYRMMAADGRVVWLHDIVTVVVENDLPTKLRGIMVDITESKTAEEALRWRTALFEAQVDAALDGILVVDLEGKKILQNERMNELWKIPRHIIEDKDDTAQVRYATSRTKDPVKFAAKVAHLYSHPEEISRDEVELVDGTVLDRYSAPVRDKTGRHYGRIWTFRDVTATKQLEEQFRQAQKMDAVGQLAGGIAHDFNNLLTVIQLHTSMILLEPSLGAAIEQSAQQIKEAAMRAANLTRQLLTFSRQNVKQARSLDIGEVVTSTTKLLRRVLGEDVSLESRFASSLPLVQADPSMMEQVLMNLVINARDAMPGGGQLCIALDVVDLDADYVALHAPARTGRFVRLSVSDTGIGISPENLPRVFEPFFTTKEIGKGTGLGLATVYGIVHQHQGWIEAESELGRGSTFRVFLPPLDAAPAGEVVPPVPTVRGGTETVLLVEDEEVVRAVTTEALQRSGYRVLGAATAAEAIRCWEEQEGKIDLLLTDLIMPGGVSGQKLAEELRARAPDLTIIFTSGYSSETVNRELQLTAGQNFLPKPYLIEELLKIVRRRLDES